LDSDKIFEGVDEAFFNGRQNEVKLFQNLPTLTKIEKNRIKYIVISKKLKKINEEENKKKGFD